MVISTRSLQPVRLSGRSGCGILRTTEKTQWLKYMARIPANCYTAIADDLTDKEAEAKIKELRKLIR